MLNFGVNLLKLQARAAPEGGEVFRAGDWRFELFAHGLDSNSGGAWDSGLICGADGKVAHLPFNLP